ncbi:hypothetical protein KEM54_001346 [Ascosphaera aggregata]|nr:hypothetical protein KEM54_001346 [Ascosphaera aggregata]
MTNKPLFDSSEGEGNAACGPQGGDQNMPHSPQAPSNGNDEGCASDFFAQSEGLGFLPNHITSQKSSSSKDGEVTTAPHPISRSSSVQQGVIEIEVLASVTSRNHLIAVYIVIWFITFVDALQATMTSSLTPYVTSSFSAHSLTAMTSIVSSLIGGISKIPLAKIFDLWGRPKGFVLVIFVFVVGLAMMAACDGVKMYAAAQVFNMVGHNGFSYFVQIFIADTIRLESRALINALVISPFIITAWIGGPVSTALYKHSTWRWGFGMFAIILPAISAPLLLVYWLTYCKAVKEGLLRKKNEEKEGSVTYPDGSAPVSTVAEKKRTIVQSLKYYSIEFDTVGLLLVCAGLSLFLLPFSIYTYQSKGWRSPLIICLIIFGGLCLIAFVVWEKFFAPKCFLPYASLTNRTVIGACLFPVTRYVSYYLWENYFQSFLQVVTNLSLTKASYVGNIYTVTSSLTAIPIGWAIRRTDRYKWTSLYFGVPLTMLGCGLMIHYRQPNVNIGYIILCQLLIALAGGANMLAERVAVMAVVSHQYVAAVLAFQGMMNSIGDGIGSTIAAAIWTSTFPQKLKEYLPESERGDSALVKKIYGSLEMQTSYPKGSPERNAIDMAYGDAQKMMTIAATAILVLSWASVMLWKDVRLRNVTTVEGRVI